jgi:multicomponent Na+:H+ antiporter subunit E
VAAAVRGGLLFALWFVLDQGTDAASLGMGLLAAACATALSLRLLPPARGQVRMAALAALLPRFLWQSMLAGIGVARRVLDPRMPLDPGFVDYPVGLPRGSARNAFELISSLLPGTVPTGEDARSIEYHCLDVTEPVVAQLAAEEAAYSRALVPGQRHD